MTAEVRLVLSSEPADPTRGRGGRERTWWLCHLSCGHAVKRPADVRGEPRPAPATVTCVNCAVEPVERAAALRDHADRLLASLYDPARDPRAPTRSDRKVIAEAERFESRADQLDPGGART